MYSSFLPLLRTIFAGIVYRDVACGQTQALGKGFSKPLLSTSAMQNLCCGKQFSEKMCWKCQKRTLHMVRQEIAQNSGFQEGISYLFFGRYFDIVWQPSHSHPLHLWGLLSKSANIKKKVWRSKCTDAAIGILTSLLGKDLWPGRLQSQMTNRCSLKGKFKSQHWNLEGKSTVCSLWHKRWCAYRKMSRWLDSNYIVSHRTNRATVHWKAYALFGPVLSTWDGSHLTLEGLPCTACTARNDCQCAHGISHAMCWCTDMRSVGVRHGGRKRPIPMYREKCRGQIERVNKQNSRWHGQGSQCYGGSMFHRTF